MPAFVKYQSPKELVDKVVEAVTVASNSGKIAKGVNETTKAIERGTARLVVMAEDVQPEEILMHIPVLCDEKKVPFAYVPSKEELGKAAGIQVPTSSIAVTDSGDSKELISGVASTIEGLKKG